MKASIFIGTSLDGFIARRDGALDFLPEGGGEPHGYQEFFASVDALVIGRGTYETVRGFDEWPYGAKPVIVLSTTLKALDAPETAPCSLMSGTPADVFERLSARGFGHVYIDGGKTVQAFLEAGLIERLIVTRVPILIGDGIPLFGPLSRDIALRHVRTQAYASGLVSSEYLIERRNADRVN